MTGFFLGIDTSCYTTSLAAVDADGRLLADERQILTVKPGRRGLAQSEMVFQHVKNLPVLLTRLYARTGARPLAGIGVSATPRDAADSYMPAFVPGHAAAAMLAASWGVPLCDSSHQAGHIRAGLWSAGLSPTEDFLAMHVSGGTTELVRVVMDTHGWRLVLLGGTADLHAGQFVDRVGVKLGLPFPAGPRLEQLARQGQPGAVEIPPAAAGTWQVSFAGPETAAQRLLAAGHSAADVAWAVEMCLARTLAELLARAVAHTGLTTILLVGGVTANLAIRQEMTAVMACRAPAARIHFPAPHYCRDNAVGVALAAWRDGNAC